MRIIVIGSDQGVFKEGSAVQKRIISYGQLVDELHIVVFSQKGSGPKVPLRISDKVWVHSTQSANKLLYVIDAFWIARRIACVSPQPDWIVSSQDPFESGIVAFAVSRNVHIPLHVQLHTDFLSPYFGQDTFLNRVRKIIGVFVIPRAHALRVVSERIKRSLEERKLVHAPIVVLPIFSGFHVPDNLVDQRTALRARFPQFEHIVLSVARLSVEKDIRGALRVMQKVIAQIPRTGFVIIGDGSERKNLEQYARDLKIADHVVFEGWHEDLVPYYVGADVFLCASLYEGYGLVLMEAARSGCAIVTTDVGLVGDTLKNGVDALVCTSRSYDCLSENVRALLTNKEKALDLANRAQQAVHAEILSYNDYLQNYLNSWKSALQQNH